MRRIIMASIIAVAFIPGVASAQMPDPNTGLEIVNQLLRDKQQVCTLNDTCAVVYDNTIAELRRALDAQRRLSDAESRHDRDEQLRIKGEVIAIAEDGRRVNDALKAYLRGRGYVIGSR